ncbi:Protein-only RNase P C-terminal, partial [Arabidopsis suecica]
MLREAVLKNGGGWHGHGWVGDGKWIVKKGNVSSTGRCLSCSEQLACVDTNEVETQKFVDSLVALAMERKAKMNSCESDVVFSEFQDWLEKHGDYEAIVDGANIGLYQQNFVDGSFSLSQVLPSILCIKISTNFLFFHFFFCFRNPLKYSTNGPPNLQK